jgi:hypothetical protein
MLFINIMFYVLFNMIFYLLLFNFIYLLTTVDLLEKNIILDVNYFKEFVISGFDKPPLVANPNSVVYLIKKNDIVFFVKQMKDDFSYETEIDYAVSMFIDYLIDKLKISRILIPKVYYIPSYVKSSIKKYQNEAAVVMTYFDNSHLNREVDLEMEINNPFKWGPEVTEEGLTHKHFDFFLLDARYIFIVALDIFFDNADRTVRNLLFDQENNIIMIDHGDCFRHPILGEKIINFLILNQSLSRRKKALCDRLIKYINFFNSIISESSIQSSLHNFFEKYISKEIQKERIKLSKLFANVDEYNRKINFLLQNYN